METDWPQTIRPRLHGHVQPNAPHIKVVPAEWYEKRTALTQELYEALEETSELAGVSFDGDPWYWENERTGKDGNAILRRSMEVRARFEREVGE